MWVKICGNTNLEDALFAAQSGADAVGFVFAPSVRQVTAEQVAAITPLLPAHVERVGVFPAWSVQQIVDVATQAKLTTAQLHGGVDVEFARAVHRNFPGNLDIIQVMHWTAETDAAAFAKEIQHFAGAGFPVRILVDSKVGAMLGGTGTTFDWRAARTVFAEHAHGLSLILAGGLTPLNLNEANQHLAPWGMDVASGVEAHPGKKDHQKVLQFIQNAKATEKK